MTSPIARATEAAEDLVGVLREHDVEGDALDATRRFARLLGRLERPTSLSVALVDGVDDRLGGVVAACGVPALRFEYPVRRAVAGLGRAWDAAARSAEARDVGAIRTGS